jgi:hypothetical protein
LVRDSGEVAQQEKRAFVYRDLAPVRKKLWASASKFPWINRFACAVADMQYDNVSAPHRVKKQVWVASHRHDPDTEALFYDSPGSRKRNDDIDRLADARFDRKCSFRTSRYQIVAYACEIAKRSRAVA